MNKFLKSAAFPILIVVLLVFVAQRLVVSSEPSSPAPTFDEFVTDIGEGRVDRATIKVESKEVDVVLADGSEFTTGYPEDYSNTLVNQLEAAKVPFEVKGIPSSPWWSSLIWLAPFILFIGFWIYLMNRMQGGGSKVMSFGKSRAKRMAVDAPKITFKDVAGADEAVEELHEIKEFLENPKKFQALGARIPKGVLLFGPPGTGKTLLGAGGGGGGGCPVLLDLRFGFRGDVRRGRREPCPGSLRAGEAVQSPASSSWMRSTPSAGTVARALGVATTSVSRP